MAAETFSVYSIIYRVLQKQAQIAGATLAWAESGRELTIAISRGGETFEIDFGRIVAMLEKRGNLDLEFSEIEQYIRVTCAMLPAPQPIKEVDNTAAMKAYMAGQKQATMQQYAQMQQQMGYNPYSSGGVMSGQPSGWLQGMLDTLGGKSKP